MADESRIRSSVLREVSSPPLPEWKLPLLASFKAKKELQQASIDLHMHQIFSIVRQQELRWEWKDLASNKEKLKKLFRGSSKVVKENKASVARFYEIIRDQKKEKLKVQQEIIYNQINIEDYTTVKETMEEYVREYSVFERYLENVAAVSQTGDLLNVGDILNRYETLEATRLDLARILASEMEAVAELRQQMIELMAEKSLALKTLANRLVMLQLTRRQAIDRRIYWENMVQRIKNTILIHEEANVGLRGSCWDFYHQICRRRKHQPSVAVHDMKSQLDYIQKSIAFYKEVLTLATGGGGNHGDRKIVRKTKTRPNWK